MANEVAKRLRDRRLNVFNQAREIADTAADENRKFTAEEQGTWEALNEEINELDKRIKAVLDQEKRAADADKTFNELTKGPADHAKTPEGSNVAAELRNFLIGSPGSPRTFDVQPTASTVPTSYRDLTKLTDAAGKFTVPTNFYNRLVEHMIEVSGILQAGPTVLNTAGGEVLQIPKTLTHTSNPAIVAEAGALLEADPTFGQTTPGGVQVRPAHPDQPRAARGHRRRPHRLPRPLASAGRSGTPSVRTSSSGRARPSRAGSSSTLAPG